MLIWTCVCQNVCKYGGDMGSVYVCCYTRALLMKYNEWNQLNLNINDTGTQTQTRKCFNYPK